jgi:hypothetical protein
MAFTKCLLPLAAVVLGSLNVAQAFSPVITRAPGEFFSLFFQAQMRK